MTNKIIETIKSRYQKTYPTTNLYYGYYTKIVKEDDIEYTFNHYDCFLGNAKRLRDCTRLKKLTGVCKDMIYSVSPEDIDLSRYDTNDTYTLQDTNNNTYTISGSHIHKGYSYKLYSSCSGKVYDKEISYNYISKIIAKQNKITQENIKKNIIKERKTQAEFEKFLTSEFGKSK